MRKLAVIIVAVACLAHGRLQAADRLDLVVLVDLSKSVAAKDQSDRAEFQKNIDGVTRVLGSLPAGSRVSIYGITDDSFGKPYPLLAAELSDDKGYFKERLAQVHRQLIRAWQERALKLEPRFRRRNHIQCRQQICRNGTLLLFDCRPLSGKDSRNHSLVVSVGMPVVRL